MDRVLFVASSGAKQLLRAQAVTANNLANANTTGFQADLANFITEVVHGPGYQTRAYATAEAGMVSIEKGSLQTTGRALDVAVNGDGWIAVQAPDGSEAYTRAGNLRVNINGQLTTATGHPVLGAGGPIVVPEFEQLEIGSDGTVSVKPIGQLPSTLAEVGRIKLVSPNPERLFKGADGLLRMRDGSQADAAIDVTLLSGVLENSNVSSVEAMVNMIAYARQYEVNTKIMSTAKEMDEKTNELLRMGS
ncbi:MAG TPA: flagellar basal-body rod protein FlgF [Gammaproteobacteria bacterium]|nr:flagellar basal-body rod protein FlgF [Gammaproteobacteria bacterium]